MTQTRDPFAEFGRIHLEKLRLATEVLLAAAEEEPQLFNDAIEAELGLVRDRIHVALLLQLVN